MAIERLSSLRSTSINAWSRPPSELGSSTAIMRQLLKIGNSSPSDMSVTAILSINDGFLSGLFSAAVKELEIEDVGESFSI